MYQALSRFTVLQATGSWAGAWERGYLYPMRSFQRCLGYCTRIRWQFLHTFADAFQGCYKNGTNGTRDYRYFAGLYLLFRIVLLAALISPMAYMWLILVLFAVVVSLSFSLFRPYKTNFFISLTLVTV